jgi:hypothetical protein
VLECAEFNVTVAEVENTGVFKLAYIFNYLSNGRKTLVTMNTETISPDQPGLFYSAGKRVQSNFWSGTEKILNSIDVNFFSLTKFNNIISNKFSLIEVKIEMIIKLSLISGSKNMDQNTMKAF